MNHQVHLLTTVTRMQRHNLMHTSPKLIYLLPNLFTAGSIFTGVISIVEASQSHFTNAAWLILLALLFDGLDGRVARLTNTVPDGLLRK